jgi:hypothetical protein
VASRFYRWQKAGIWQKMLEALQEQSEAADELDWEQHYVDSTVIRAHQHAAGATGGNPEAEALGRSQGGFSTKLHLRAEGKGKPMTLVLTPGQYHEAPLFETLMEQWVVSSGPKGGSNGVPSASLPTKATPARISGCICDNATFAM